MKTPGGDHTSRRGRRGSHPAVTRLASYRGRMVPYEDRSGDSGVVAYALGADYIKIRFRNDGTYLYNGFKPGRSHVEEMKRLAVAGRGLSTYVSRNVRDNFAEKLDD